MMGYIAIGNLNIRIHRELLVRCGLGWIYNKNNDERHPDKKAALAGLNITSFFL